jgi:SRSO17 transposase
MAARLAPDDVRRMHQSLHHLVADARWDDEAILAQVRQQVLPVMQKYSPFVARIIDDTGFPKQGTRPDNRRVYAFPQQQPVIFRRQKLFNTCSNTG